MPEVEHQTKVLPLDGNLKDELAKLEAEGWDLIPGILPQVIYQLVRVTQKPEGDAQGVIRIDDTKVHLIRNGEKVA